MVIRAKGIHGVVFDLDGTIWHGEKPDIDADQVLNHIRGLEIKVAFSTNTASKSPEEIAEKGQRLGLSITYDQIYSVGRLTSQYAKENYPDHQYLITGEENSLFKQFVERGLKCWSLDGHLNIAEKEKILLSKSHCVALTSFNREFGYSQLKRIFQLREWIDELWVAGNDRWYGGESGKLPATSWITASVADILQMEPRYFGKPNAEALSTICKDFRLEPSMVMMIGDSYESDIAAAKNAGLQSCIVGRKDLNSSEIQAEFSISRLRDIIPIIEIS